MSVSTSTSKIENLYLLHILVYIWIWYCLLKKKCSVWWVVKFHLTEFWFAFPSLLMGCVLYWPFGFLLLWIASSHIFFSIRYLSVKNWFTGILLIAWILRFHWSYYVCCKYFLLIFSVSFKVIFAKVLYSIIVCINLCFCFARYFCISHRYSMFFSKVYLFIFCLFSHQGI